MVRKRKTLSELTIKDNFMFAAVMLKPENAKGLLELTLGIEIDYVAIEKEKSILYNPDYKGVRLDVFIKDGNGTHFNVEMQATSQKIEKRARYYQSQLDMDALPHGKKYDTLPDSYILFICDFDPFGLQKFRYTVRQTLEEKPDYHYSDGLHKVFLSTAGTNEDEVPEALVKFLKFVAADYKSSNEDYDDPYVKQLQDSVKEIKTKPDMEGHYMLFEEMMQNEYNAGHEDGLQEGLVQGLQEGLVQGMQEGLAQGMQEGLVQGRNKGKTEALLQVLTARFTISDTLSGKLQQVNDEKELTQLITVATVADTADAFEAELDRLLSLQVKSTDFN